MIKSLDFKNLYDLLLFALCFGYPKVPGLSVPIGLIVLGIDGKRFFGLIQRKEIRAFVFISLGFLLMGLVRLIFNETTVSLSKELFFILSQQYKIVIGIYCGSLLYLIIERNPMHIVCYMLVQVSLMVASGVYEGLYTHLLSYQTGSSNNVFNTIFGLRSVGFGLIHNEGVANIVALYFICIADDRIKFVWKIIVDLAIYGSVFMSRMGVLLIILVQLVRKRIAAVVCLIFVLAYVYTIGVREDTILGETFELVLNYQRTGQIATKSSTDIMGMRWLPSSQKEFWLGSGQFFSDEGFYNDTDIGFARIMFFGGIFYVLGYLVLNIWGFFLERVRSNLRRTDLLFLLIIFLVANIKSIILLNWVMVYYVMKSKKYSSHQERPNFDPRLQYNCIK